MAVGVVTWAERRKRRATEMSAFGSLTQSMLARVAEQSPAGRLALIEAWLHGVPVVDVAGVEIGREPIITADQAAALCKIASVL